MRTTSRIRNTAIKTAIAVSLAAGAMLANALPAAAQGGHAYPTTHGTVQPQGACAGDPGPFAEVYYDYGNVYHVVYGPKRDDNGTAYAATVKYSNTWSGTVSATVSASVQLNVNEVVAAEKADLGISVTASASISVGHEVTYTVAPHRTLYAEYAETQRHTMMEKYYQNSGCTMYNITKGDAYTDEGDGWHTWTAAYNG